MNTGAQSIYDNKALQPFVEKLLENHYYAIGKLCVNANAQAEKLIRLETSQATSQYTSLCVTTVKETSQYIQMRMEKIIPYVLKLSEKSSTNHNCSSCSGNCKLNHDIQLLELKASNDMMQEMLNKLQIASLPLYSETLYPEQYRLLRNQMSLIETSLTELFFLENNYLIPKIVEAQKSINAGNQ